MDGQKTQCRYCWTKTNTWLHTYWNIQTSVVVPIMLTPRTNNHKAIAVDLLPSSNWERVICGLHGTAVVATVTSQLDGREFESRA